MIRVREYITENDERLLDGLAPAMRVMQYVESVKGDEPVILDFSEVAFVSPVTALSLQVYLSKCRKPVIMENVPESLQALGLADGGIRPDRMRRTEFVAMMEKYSSKTYIPIINFAAGRNVDDKESISTVVENILIRQLSISSNIATGLKYMLGEMLDNITEHSESERGWIFAHTHPQHGYLDICLADTGVTLLGSYIKLPGNEIVTDLEAIKAANRGISSKNLPDAENRGYGIQTSKRMLVEGLAGQYMMISGSCLYVKTRSQDSVYNIPDGLRWDGTLVALRIPVDAAKFNYIEYIE